jgi:acyl CoA:acetate/3-ketoacid CoA transferase beta subunit
MKKQKINNVVDLRDDLLQVYTQMRNGMLGIDEARQAANVAGKIMSTAKTQIEYNKMTHSKERIPFLDVPQAFNQINQK